jgi:hypothetical protein
MQDDFFAVRLHVEKRLNFGKVPEISAETFPFMATLATIRKYTVDIKLNFSG